MGTALQVSTAKPAGGAMPALIAGAGERAGWRFLEFFTVNIRNKNTRAAYARAAAAFLRWCIWQGIGELGQVQPVHVAAYIEALQAERAAPTVKQHLAAIRMLFDWLVTGQVMPSNPAHAVRGPRCSVSKGSTPVLSSEEATGLPENMDVSTAVGLRDRAIIAVMTYTFARVGAVVALNVEDYYAQKNAGGCASAKKTVSSTKYPVTRSWKTTWTPISKPRASAPIARGRCSATRSGKPALLRASACRGRMSGTWSAAVLPMPA
jgi:site-specific recombinase XerC